MGGVGVEGPRSLSCSHLPETMPPSTAGLLWSPPVLDSPSSLRGPRVFWLGPASSWALGSPALRVGQTSPRCCGRFFHPVRGLARMRLRWNSREARAVMAGGLRLCSCVAHTSGAGSWRPGLLASGKQAGPVFARHRSVSGICSSWPQQPSVAVWPGLGFASPCHEHHGTFSLVLRLPLCPLVSQNTPQSASYMLINMGTPSFS